MKKKIIRIRQLAAGAVCVLLLVGLSPRALQAQTKKLSATLQGYATGNSTENWIDFREGVVINPTSIFEDLKEAFELSADDQMKLQRVQDDNIGFKHYRYQQFYKNKKVMYGEFIVHQNDKGYVQSANGRLIKGLRNADAAAFNEEQALGKAINFMRASKYLWQNPEMEAALKKQTKDESATYYPKGELVFVPANNKSNYDAAGYRLAWKFDVRPDGGDVLAKSVYVDAVSGEVIHYVDIAMNCSAGSGTSAFNGAVTVRTQQVAGVYRSLNDCQTTSIYVYNCNGGSAANTFYTDADNAWTNTSAIQAQFGAAQVYSYYNGQHSRQSWDGSNGDMIAYNNAVYGGTANNACWGCFGNNTIYGAGSTSAATDDWNTDDIMGHEFTHGVTQDEAGLIYSNESGALNESFSDIFGEMVESWTEGNNDWLVGADRGAIRSFSNPNSFNDPDTYLGTNWYTGTGDNGGVHTNSSVQNFWFYLISNGGSGTNDLGKPYNVTAIGRFKGRDIAYRALTNYLTSSSAYIDARAASLRAALDLYGRCSVEIQAVGDAWHAVGVESQSAQYVNDVCGTVASGDFKQAISVLTGNGCGSGNTIAVGTNITYYAARDRVVLYPGFRAPAGSRFIAYLEPCSSTMYRTGGSNKNVIMSDAERGIKAPIVALPKSVNEEKAAPAAELAEGVRINPNPFVSNFELTINAKEDAKTQVFVYNSIGMKVSEKAGINVVKGNNKITFDGSSLPRGIYMVEINMNGVKTVKKIVKM